MRKLALAGLFAGALLLVLLLGLSRLVDQVRGPAFDPVAYEAGQIAIDHMHQLAPVDLGLAVFWKLFPAGVALVAVGLAAAWGSAAIARFQHERQPDAAGLLPVPRDDLGDVAQLALTGYHQARIEDARRQLVPASLTYSPHIAPRLDYRGEPERAALPAPHEPATDVRSFGDLLSQGRIGRGQPLLLGYDLADGAPIWGSWRDLYSAGVGGAQGGGKTWTAASLIAQSMLNGARVILCDPHAGDEESLTTRLGPLLPAIEVHADNERQIAQAARYAADELARRRDTKRSDRTPIVLVIDEWTSLLRRGLAEQLPPILSDLTQEGRKYGVNALLLAQRWSVEAAGGGDVRNTLTAHYVHRTRADEARMQTGLRGGALPDDTMQLHPGQSYLVDTRGNVRKVATPQMQAADLARVATLLGGGPGFPQASQGRLITPPADAWRKPDGSLMEASGDLASNAPGSAEAARVLALFRQGLDIAQIVAELRGIEAGKGGRRYQDAAAEVQALLRQALGYAS